MKIMEEIKIYKLSEYMEYVESLPNGYSISRGHSNSTYNLLPSALRFDEAGNRKYTRQSIAYFLNEFKVNSHNYLEYPWDIKSDFEWMIYAQHYGLPTRLLDFTYSHIISLMFAVENAFMESEPEDGSVWFLNPMALNNKHCKQSQILTFGKESISNLDNFDGGVVVQGRKINKRITAQNGVFVYFQDNTEPLEKQICDDEVLRKIVIDGEAKRDIVISLYSLGIGKTQIYPELSSVVQDILIKDNIKQYMEEE